MNNKLTEQIKTTLGEDYSFPDEVKRLLEAISKEYDQLETTQQELNSIFESVSDGITITSLTGQVQKMNHAMELVGGYKPEEFIGKKFNELLNMFTPGSLLKMAATFSALMLTGKPITTRIEHIRADGTHVELEVSSSLLRKNGVPIGIVNVSRDISKTERAESERNKSEKRFQELVELLPEIVFETDLESKFKYINKNGSRLMGYTQEEFLNNITAYDLVIPEERELVKKNIEKLFTNPEDAGNKYTALHKDGHTFPVYVYASIIKEGEKPIGIRGLVIDISKIVAAEEQLQKLTIGLEKAKEAIVLIEDNMKIGYFNPSAVRILGLDPETALNNEYTEFFKNFTTSEELEKIKNSLISAVIYEGEFTRNTGNEILQIKMSITPIRNKNGIPIGYLVFGIDVTDEKRTAARLSELLNLQKIINTVSTNFLSASSNDMDKDVNFALKALGESMDLDRTYLFQFSKDLARMSNSHEWVREGVSSEKDKLQNLDVKDYQWFMDKLLNHENVVISDTQKIPDERIRQKMLRQNIKSMVLLPMFFEDKIFGFVGFDHVRNQRTWSSETLEIFKVFSDIVLNGIQQYKISEDMMKQNRELERLNNMMVHREIKMIELKKQIAGKNLAKQIQGETPS